MTQTVGSDRPRVEKVRQAFTAHDLPAFGAHLSDDVTRGNVNTPRGCRNRSDVLITFAQALDKRVDGCITEMETGTAGIVSGLGVARPEGDPRETETSLFYDWLVRNGRIFQIRR